MKTCLTIGPVSGRVRGTAAAFTLIELVVVIAIMGAIFSLLGWSSGTFSYWKEEAALRRIIELITFSHNQAVMDQAFYRLEFGFKPDEPSYFRLGMMRPFHDVDNRFALLASQSGQLTFELAVFLNPASDTEQTMIPPSNFPSLAEPTILPPGMVIDSIRTRLGKITPEFDGNAAILFSPRGFSDFAVIHIKLSNGQPITILVNSFTGTTQVFREFRDFEWAYDSRKK